LSFLSAVFAFFWLYFAVTEERSLLRNPTVTGGIALLLVGAAYGGVEVVRRFRRLPPHIYLPLSTLFVVVVFLSGGLLIINGLLARRRTAATRTLEELRAIDYAIDHATQQSTPESK
jgi:hypothetical protein